MPGQAESFLPAARAFPRDGPLGHDKVLLVHSKQGEAPAWLTAEQQRKEGRGGRETPSDPLFWGSAPAQLGPCRPGACWALRVGVRLVMGRRGALS